MAEAEKKEKGEVIVVEIKELPDGTCHVRKWAGKKVSVCREGGKIKIFEVVKED